MSRLFLMPDRWNKELETTLLSEVENIDFHVSNYSVIKGVALNFKNGDMVTRFTSDFLDTVYGKLIGPAREFGYYYGDMPKSERCQMIRTSSASQYGGDDVTFSSACVVILSAIDEERARREQLSLNVMKMG